MTTETNNVRIKIRRVYIDGMGWSWNVTFPDGYDKMNASYSHWPAAMAYASYIITHI